MKLSKQSVKPFLAGSVLTASVLVANSAIGTSGLEPKTEQVIRSTVEETTRAVIQGIQEEEDRRLESIPDPLDCNSFSWMESCEQINRHAKKHPTAPIRVRNKDGIEFNFPPGTSTAMMRHMLDGTDESTLAFIEELDKKMDHHQKAADRYKRILWARGGLNSMETSADVALREQSQPRDTIDTDKVSITAFYDTACTACKVVLNNLKLLKEKYPDLKITAFQIDDDPSGPAQVTEYYGLPARQISSNELAKLQATGFQGAPTLWVDNRPEKKRMARVGPISLTVIENVLERTSLYKSEGQ